MSYIILMHINNWNMDNNAAFDLLLHYVKMAKVK